LTVPNYRRLLLSLDLGLRGDSTWRFVVADVTHILIGVNFSNFGLFVGCEPAVGREPLAVDFPMDFG
jgi:hypothetical protein